MQHKLAILADAAKYDVSCSSSGSRRRNAGGLGNASPSGICHSFTEDGRCISLLKVLFSNVCRYDCAYCANRRGNDIPRATFQVREVVELTLEFYRRNLIEGLFLSSSVFADPDTVMESLCRVAEALRQERFGGYIHLKAIPGATQELVRRAGLSADRLSVNIEIPSDGSLRKLAPEKNYASVLTPMRSIRQGILEWKGERRISRRVPDFAPAGQTTQLIVGASPENDLSILTLASGLYHGEGLRRVYYSGYIPVNRDARLPVLSAPPLHREHRLYQADWLMRFYHFGVEEIVDPSHPDLDLELDPKAAWALRHPEAFPVDLDRASYGQILRVPGIGVLSAKRIVQGRRFGTVRLENLRRMGVVLKRALPFLHFPGALPVLGDPSPERLRPLLRSERTVSPAQLSFFDPPSPELAS